MPIVYAPRNNTASPPSGFPCRPAPGRTRPEFEAAAGERPGLSGALSAPPQQQLPAPPRLPIHHPCASPSRKLGLASPRSLVVSWQPNYLPDKLHEGSVLPAPEALSFRGSVIIYQPIVYAPRNNTASPPSGFPCRPAPGRTRPEFEAAADERPGLSGALSAPPQQQLPAHTRLPIHRPCASPSRRLGLASPRSLVVSWQRNHLPDKLHEGFLASLRSLVVSWQRNYLPDKLHEGSVLPAPEALSFRGSVIIYQTSFTKARSCQHPKPCRFVAA